MDNWQLRLRRFVVGSVALGVVTACSSAARPTVSPTVTAPLATASDPAAPSAAPGQSVPTLGTLDSRPPPGPARTLASTVIALHDNSFGAGPSPKTAFGGVRLWDSGVTWRDLEPSPGRWNWSRLDKAVAASAAAKAEPLLVLGQTPQFAALPAMASSTGTYGPGANAMPVLSKWRAYVRAVATRYKGRIRTYEIWNEPNVVGFWAGTPQQMALLATSARSILKAIDPSVVITTPGVVVRRPTQRGWLSRYLAAGGLAAADVVNVHLYPDSAAKPEDVAATLTDVRARLAAANVTKPIWDTEINYGLPTGGAAGGSTLPDAVQAGYVARTFLVAAQLGIERTYWYAWDNQTVGIRTMTPTGQLTAAGAAFTTIGNWLVGHSFRGCLVDAEQTQQTWSCYVDHDRIVWNVSGDRRVGAPPGTTAVLMLNGSSTATTAGASAVIGRSPVTFVGGGAAGS